MANDHPFWEVAEQVGQHIMDGHSIHQKFTCSGCGSRQTMAEPNKMFSFGECEECGHTTDLQQKGCNYVIVTRASPAH
jgi:hypothetical protein